MDPVTMGLVGGLVSAGAGAIGAWLAGGASEEEKKARREQLEEYSALASPQHQDIIAQGVKESAYSRVRGDAGLRAQQDRVQDRLVRRGEGETSMAYRARGEEARMQAARTAQGDREAILQEGRARGTVGSGEELLLQQDANQQAAEQERMAGVQAQADEEEAALQALMAGGAMAGQREERDLNTQMGIAGGMDDIAMFNAGQTNAMAVNNAQLRGSAWDRSLAVADRRAGIHRDTANRAREGAAGLGAAIGGIGQGAGYGIAAYGQQGGMAPKQAPAVAPKVTPRTATPYEQANPASIGPKAALGVQTKRRAR
jgi:hypothetical protein